MNEQRATEPTLSYFLLLIVQERSEGSCVFCSSQELTAEPERGIRVALRHQSIVHCAKNHRPLRCITERAVVTHTYQKLLLDHKNLTAEMPRMQVTAIDQRIPLRGVEHVTGRDTDVLSFARLQHHFSFHHSR